MVVNDTSTFYSSVLPSLKYMPAVQKTKQGNPPVLCEKTLQAASTPIILPSHQVNTSNSPVIVTSAESTAEQILELQKKPTRAQFHNYLKMSWELLTAYVSVK